MEKEPQIDIFSSIPAEFAGKLTPPPLSELINEAARCNKLGFGIFEDEMEDSYDAVSNACLPLNKSFRKYGYAGDKAYIAINVDGDEVEYDCNIERFAPHRVDAEFDGGCLIDEPGWNLGLKVTRWQPDNADSDDDGYYSDIITLKDIIDIEPQQARFQRMSDRALATLVRKGINDNFLSRQNYGRFNLLKNYLKDSHYRHMKARKVGRFAGKIVNSKIFKDDLEVQDAIGSMIMSAYGSGRYDFRQTLVTEPAIKTGKPGALTKKQGTRTRNIIDGRLISVAMIPDIESRKKVIVPNFVVTPTGGNFADMVCLPLESNLAMGWLNR